MYFNAFCNSLNLTEVRLWLFLLLLLQSVSIKKQKNALFSLILYSEFIYIIKYFDIKYIWPYIITEWDWIALPDWKLNHPTIVVNRRER